MTSDAEIVSSIEELKSLPSDIHWFCPRSTGEDQSNVYFDEDIDENIEESEEEKQARHKQVSEAGERLYTFSKAIRIIAYEGDAAKPYEDALTACLKTQLTRCNICVRQYHRNRTNLQQELESEFGSDTVITFMQRFDEVNIERIKQGLSQAQQALQALPASKRKISVLEGAALFSLFETVHCVPILTNDTALRQSFDEPFRLAQTNRKIFLQDYTPAHVAFMFGPDQYRTSWALFNWGKMQRPVREVEFEHDLKDLLVSATKRVQITALEKDFMSQFWKGIAAMMSKMSQKAITHHLRGMDSDLCKLALDHLQIDSPCFLDLLTSIRLYLQVAPKDFWDALGSISAQAVVEQIFNSPNFESIVQEAGAGSTEELENSLSWISPFLQSIQPINLPPACRSLIHQLWTRHQKSNYPGVARRTLRLIGLKVLVEAFDICQRAGLSNGTAISDLLNTFRPHLKTILDIASKSSESTDEDITEAALDIIKSAIASDVVLLASDKTSILRKDGSALDSAASSADLWQTAVRAVGLRDTSLALAILEGCQRLVVLDRFTDKQRQVAPKDASTWTARLTAKHDAVRELLERMQDFDESFLKDILKQKGAAVGFLGLLFSADAETQRATATTLRSLTGETSRGEAITSMLNKSYGQSLIALSDILHMIAQSQVLRPSIMVIKAGSDFVQALCDTRDGILGTKELSSDEIAITERVWKAYWTAIQAIFYSTEQWAAMGYEDVDLKEFCRDAMDFASRTFDVYSIISGSIHESSNSKDARAETDRSLLTAPAEASIAIVRWLRLRDEYLVTKAIALFSKLMGRLEEVGLEVPAAALDYASDIVHDAVKNKVPESQKAELGRALDRHLDGVLSEQNESTSTKSYKQGSLGGWISSGAATSTTSQRPEKKRQGIDLDAWKSAAGQRRDIKSEEGSVLKKLTSSVASTQDKFKASGLSKGPGAQPAKPSESQQVQRDEFLRKRQAQLDAKKKRDLAAIAAANRSRAGISNAGSGLAGIGVEGKDHSARGQGVMVSSDESSDDDEGGLDADLFGKAPKDAKKAGQSKQTATKTGAVRREVKPTVVVRQVRNKKDMRARIQPDLGPLHSKMLSWDFFHTGDYPPGSDEWQFQKVANAFKHVEDYKNTFRPLLMLEAWQGMVKAREEDVSKPFEIKIGNRMSVDSFIELSTSVSPAEFRDLQVSEGDIILFSQSKKPTVDADAPHCLSRVYGIKRKGKTTEVIYRVMPNTPLTSSLTPGAQVYCAKVQSIIPLEREYGSIAGLPYYDLCDEIVKARPSPLLNYTDKQLDPLISNYNVNKAQAKAIRSAMDNDAFTLIQGPPGSGKTKTIVAIVGAILTDSIGSSNGVTKINVPGAQSNGGMVKKLLVCAPSNAAVDELVMRLKEGIKTTRGTSKKLNVVRLGRSEAINSAVVDVTLDKLVEAKLGGKTGDGNIREKTQALMQEHKKVSEALNNLREKLNSDEIKGEEKSKVQDEFNDVRRRKVQLGTQIDNAKDAENAAGRNAEMERRRAQQAVIDESHVICATLSGSGHDIFQSISVEFETVVVDEAAQCVEMSALIPLKYGCAKCILVGDPKQLPPTVFSKEAARFQYEQSLFVRMQANFPDAVHLLDTQYRMHPDISSFPSATFYDGRLLDGADMAGLRQRDWHSSSLLAPYNFFDVKGQHSAAPKGHSLVNIAEIDVAMLLYERLIKDYSNYDFNNKIGIITPYKSQLRQLKETFSNRYGQSVLESVEFNTTDAFQGRESEIIIFSCVRASPAGGIGFLQDIRRMNVGLTRAKCSLWVLGNSDSLGRGQYWKKLIDDAKARDLHITGDLKGMLRKPSSAYPAKASKVATKSKPMADTSRPKTEATEHGKPNGTRKVIESKPSEMAMFKTNDAPRRPSATKPTPIKVEPMEDIKSHSTKTARHMNGINAARGVKRERESSVSSTDKMDIDSDASKRGVKKEIKREHAIVKQDHQGSSAPSSRTATPALGSSRPSSRDATPTEKRPMGDGGRPALKAVAGAPPPQKRKAASSVFMPKKKR